MSAEEVLYGLVIWVFYINWVFQPIWFNILSWFFWLELALSLCNEYQYNIRPEIGLIKSIIFIVFFICTLDSIMELGRDFWLRI